MLKSLRRQFAKVLFARRPTPPVTRLYFRPQLEGLERRLVPAQVLYYRGSQTSTDGNVIGNYATYNGTTYEVATGNFTVDDELIFRLTNEELRDVTFTAAMTVKRIAFEASYTKTATLNATVTATTTFSLVQTSADGLIIAGNGDLVIGGGTEQANFTIEGGIFNSSSANAEPDASR